MKSVFRHYKSFSSFGVFKMKYSFDKFSYTDTEKSLELSVKAIPNHINNVIKLMQWINGKCVSV